MTKAEEILCESSQRAALESVIEMHKQACAFLESSRYDHRKLTREQVMAFADAAGELASLAVLCAANMPAAEVETAEAEAAE